MRLALYFLLSSVLVAGSVACDEAGDGDVDDDPNIEPVLVSAVDVSVWTTTLTDSDVDCLWEMGMRVRLAAA